MLQYIGISTVCNCNDITTKGQTISKAYYGFLDSPKNERNSVEKMLRIGSFVRSFGRIEKAINCFRDLLMFSYWFWQFAGKLWLFPVNSFKIFPIIKSKQIWSHAKGSILYLPCWISSLLAISDKKKSNWPMESSLSSTRPLTWYI